MQLDSLGILPCSLQYHRVNGHFLRCFHLTYVMLLAIFYHYETIQLQNVFAPSQPYVTAILEISFTMMRRVNAIFF